MYQIRKAVATSLKRRVNRSSSGLNGKVSRHRARRLIPRPICRDPRPRQSANGAQGNGQNSCEECSCKGTILPAGLLECLSGPFERITSWTHLNHSPEVRLKEPPDGLRYVSRMAQEYSPTGTRSLTTNKVNATTRPSAEQISAN